MEAERVLARCRNGHLYCGTRSRCPHCGAGPAASGSSPVPVTAVHPTRPTRLPRSARSGRPSRSVGRVSALGVGRGAAKAAARPQAIVPARTAPSPGGRPSSPPVVPRPSTVVCTACSFPNAIGESYCQRCGQAVQSTRLCPGCYHYVAQTAPFCHHCGRTLTATSLICTHCGRAYPAAEIYCQDCAQPLTAEVNLPNCGHLAPQNVRYCPDCGVKT